MTDALAIKTISRLSGVSEHTLRAWERRYEAIKPKRTSTGRRSYSLSDVEKVKLLNRLVEGGHSIGRIAHYSIQELEKLIQAGEAGSSAHDIAALNTGFAETEVSILNEHTFRETKLNPQLLELLDDLKAYRLEEVDLHLRRARAQVSVKAFIFDWISPLLQELGELVRKETFGIAHEHALSAMIKEHLLQIYQGLLPHSAGETRVVLSTPEGDLHEFGILMSAILCATHHMSVRYLGPNIPAADLADAAQGLRANLVILGTCPLPREKQVTQFEVYLRQLAQRLSPEVEILVGGHEAQHPVVRSLQVNSRSGEMPTSIRYCQNLSDLDLILSRFSGQNLAPR
jgi:DNA-binding transcriptional MerR regulator